MKIVDPSVALGHAALMLHFENLRIAMLNRCTSSAGLAIGTAATTSVKIVNTTNYLNGGLFLSKASAEIAFTTAANIAANANSVQEQVFVVCLDAAGNGYLIGGGVFTGAGNALMPERSAWAGYTEIGTVRIAVAAGATSFVGGTTALSNGALTVTYTNLSNIIPSFNAAQ